MPATVYYDGKLQTQSNQALRLFLAFQSGFFWRSVMAGIVPG
jgi:hypothetical protein